ncbi:MAG TPA: amino acid adenylation domain-containing protein, partial [Chthonomonadaceae bacterium]|nr:amino acid adenylation domain-containing protein [Chthonomonadaceae bacterium]
MREDQIEDVYALSPMQGGMLFHTLYAEETSAYLDQQVFALQGMLDTDAFEGAWRYLIERHPVLRTSFHWEGLEEPLQVVHGSVELPLEHRNESHLSEGAQQARIQEVLHAHRTQGIEISQAPLMRMTLIRTGPASWHFVWTVHHLLLDRWSTSQLLNELGVAYEAHRRGERIALPPVRPFGDYIGWLQAQDPARAEAYWRRTLAGFTHPTALPVDRSPGAQPGPDLPVRLQIRLSEETSAALQALARRHRLTINTLVQGVWALLLSRYSGEEDVLFGATVSGRPASLAGVETMVGMFINSLPVRVRVPGSASLVEWLQQLQESMLELREYEYSALIQVQGWSDIPRGTPLFDSLVVVQNTPTVSSVQEPGEDPEPGGALKVRSVGSESSANFPLMLLAVPGRQLTLVLSYDVSRYECADMTRMLGHLEVLLEGIASDPDRKIASLPLLTEAERHQWLEEFNATSVAWDEEVCIPTWFERQVERTPEAVALRFQDQYLTYRELNRQANQLALALRKRGVGPETLVGVYVERSVEMVVGVLGVWKAGGAYLPLDPEYPQERIAFTLEDANVHFVLTQPSLAPRLEGQGLNVIVLEPEGFADQDRSNPLLLTTPRNLAYVIYTSGSTGRPKGVLLDHHGLFNYLRWGVDAYAVQEGAGAPVHSPLGFDLTITSLYMPLLTGRTVTLLPEDGAVEQLGATLAARPSYSLVKLTPAHVELLSQMLPAEVVGESARTLVIGGEALTAEHLAFWRANAPHVRLINEYGPTETVVGCCIYEAPPHVALSGAIPIGRPIANTRLFILNPQMQPVPVGVSGELYIGGAGLARGYLNRAELTAEKFVPDPFSSEPGARLYRTGDLCRFLPDGNIAFQGRIDHQVKVRGFRIELGEIESALREYPAISEAVVLAREDVVGDKRLVAYVVSNSENAVSVSALREYLKARLPEYMVPSAFVLLEALPLNANGKVDRKALPAPEMGAVTEQEYVAPRTPIEAGVAEVWSEVLRLESVGAHANFFELGGHSLLATQVISRLRSAFQVELPLRALFEAPTVAELAARVEQARGEERISAPPLLPTSRSGPLPLSFSQQRLWFLDQYEPGSSVYNIPGALRLHGPLNVAALEHSLQEIVRRHEALRTTFTQREGVGCQVIQPPDAFTLPMTDLSAWDAEAREREARRLSVEEAERPFDLEHGPLFRAALLQLTPEEHILLVTMHHIVSDGWSQGILVRELTTFYRAFAAGSSSPLPDLPIQYADYAAWQRGWLDGEELERQVAYWRGHLAEAPSLLELPTDRPRPALQTFRGEIERYELSPELTQGIKALGQNEGATLFMTLLAAFQTLLSRYSHQEDIVVGTPIANRTRAEVEGVIGLFLNTLALRGDLSGDPSFRELLGRVREAALGAYAHQDLPFEKLVEELQPERTLGYSPIFQMMFILHNIAPALVALPGVSAVSLPV